jgi:hypothetical protein
MLKSRASPLQAVYRQLLILTNPTSRKTMETVTSILSRNPPMLIRPAEA